MDIQIILRNLSGFLLSMRGSGTTTLIKKVAIENDVYVLVPYEQMGQEFGDHAITFNRLGKARGLKPKPILTDNYTLREISELSLNKFDILDAEIKELQSKLFHANRLRMEDAYSAIDEANQLRSEIKGLVEALKKLQESLLKKYQSERDEANWCNNHVPNDGMGNNAYQPLPSKPEELELIEQLLSKYK